MQKLLFVLSVFLLIIMHNLSFAQNNEELIKVTDQLYMISGLGGNVTFLVTEDGVLLVDSGNEPNAAKVIKKYVCSVTDKPIKYLVYTHYHLDHTLGALGFNKDFTIIGQENIVYNLKTFARAQIDNYLEVELPQQIRKSKLETDSLRKINNEKWKESQANYEKLSVELEETKKYKLIFPDITFKDGMNIYLGNDTITFKFPGNTHTNCNVLVEFKNQNAVVTGDFLFSNGMPYIDYNAKCNTLNWIGQLKKLNSMNYKYVIPGHGKLASGKDLLNEAEYLSDLRDSVQSFILKNKSLVETQNELKMEKYSNYDFQFMLASEIEAVYKELKGM